MDSIKIFLLISLISGSLAVDLKALFKGCDETVLKMKMGMVVKCAKSELTDLMEMAKKESGGSSNPNDLIKKLQDPNFQTIIIPSVATTICGKRLQLLNCTAPLTNLDCLDSLHNIILRLGMKLLIRPVFKYTCEEIVKKNALGDMLACGMNMYPKYKSLLECKPEAGSVKGLEHICGVIGNSYGCFEEKLNKSCSAQTVSKVSGLVNLITEEIGCTFPLPVEEIVNSLSGKDDPIEAIQHEHVNVNHFHKSAGPINLCGMLTLVVPVFILSALR